MSRRRPPDYLPLDDYGVVGDMRSAALVSRDGSIDWMCLPRFDSPSVFARLLDARRGGHLSLRALDAEVTSRQYRTDSNALQTTWLGGRSQAQVIDFMPVRPEGEARTAPRSVRLVRVIEPVRGQMTWSLVFRPAFDYARSVPRLRAPGRGVVIAASGDTSLRLEFPAHFTLRQARGWARLTGKLEVGRPGVVVLHQGGRQARPAGFQAAQHWLQQTDSFWRSWLSQCTYAGRYAHQLRRSALVLKLLQYEPTGAFVAAPTTSLPEAPGGSLNWDYRFTWLRDMSVLVNTLQQLGFHGEAEGFMDWLDRRCASEPGEFQMLYRVDGRTKVSETELDWLSGYRRSRPVRVGNAAADQRQLDVYGEIMETAFASWRHDKRLPRARRRMLLGIVDHVLEHWTETDAGIWESRERRKRYIYSQVMCWLALDRALAMDASLRLGPCRRERARRTRRAIKHEIMTRGFDRRRRAFTQALDDDTLDAAGLTVPLTGMVPANHPTVVSTVSAVRRRLMRSGLVYRYDGRHSEFGQDEGAFLVCSFWLVDVLAQMDRQDEAERLFARLTRTANDLGLLAEEFDPSTGTMLGNFPLALSHLSMIGAILNLERSARSR